MPADREPRSQAGSCAVPQVAKLDFLVWLVSLVGTVCLGVGTGLTIAISLVSSCRVASRNILPIVDFDSVAMASCDGRAPRPTCLWFAGPLTQRQARHRRRCCSLFMSRRCRTRRCWDGSPAHMSTGMLRPPCTSRAVCPPLVAMFAPDTTHSILDVTSSRSRLASRRRDPGCRERSAHRVQLMSPVMSGRNVKQYPDAEQLDGVLIVRLDAPLYFANSRFIRDRLRRYKRKAEARAAPSVHSSSGLPGRLPVNQCAYRGHRRGRLPSVAFGVMR